MKYINKIWWRNALNGQLAWGKMQDIYWCTIRRWIKGDDPWWEMTKTCDQLFCKSCGGRYINK